METLITTILVNILSNVLTQILLDPTYKGEEGKEPLKPCLDTNLTPILQKAVAKVGRSLELQYSQQEMELRRFLVLPEVDTIVRQVYSSKLFSDAGSLEEIRTEFDLLYGLHLPEGQTGVADLIPSQNLFDLICNGCEKAIDIAIDRGVLSAHEAKSSVRYRLVMDELAAIQKNLDCLQSQKQPNIQDFLKFEKTYRKQIACRHGKIMPPYFSNAHKFPLDQLYVCPNFSSLALQRSHQDKSLALTDFLAKIYRVVLLGNPGGGKSTFTDKLCKDLATRYEDKLLSGRQVTPIHVVLREYGKVKKTHQCSILQFIETTASSKYKVQPPDGAFEYLLLNGRVVVIFDGLDELLDTSYRQIICGDVEAFCNLYPSVPVVVTSREVGYEQAPLDDKRFETFTLSPFKNHQVEEYAKKWFSLGDNGDVDWEQKKQAFLVESESVPDLRSNPLILGLLCNIYRGEGYIPRNRPDVYEKCAMMLFEKWDKSRGIEVGLPFQQHIRPTMMKLAYWIYADEALQGGVTEKKLIKKTTDYLHEKRFEDYDEAEQSACQFVEFCRGRAWVFTDVGTTKDGERLYQFTHRTFLEYFTAKQLVRSCRTPKDLEEILLPKIADGEWDVVAQIAFQEQEKSTEGAADELLQSLINSSKGFKDEQIFNILSFASRCLEFIVPSPKIRKEITQSCFQFCMNSGMNYLNAKSRDKDKYSTSRDIDLIDNLSKSSPENLTTVLGSIESFFTQKIQSKNKYEGMLAFEILLSSDFSNILLEKIVYLESSRIKKICTNSSPLLFKFISRTKIVEINQSSIREVMDCIDSFSRDQACDILHTYSNIFEYSLLAEPILWIMDTILSVDRSVNRNYMILVEKIGKLLFRSIPLRLEKNMLDDFKSHWNLIFSENPVNYNLNISDFNVDQIFGCFLMIAILFEIRIGQEDFLNDVLPESMTCLLAKRYKSKNSNIELAFKQLGFNQDQQEMIKRWIKKEIYFIDLVN